MHFGSGFFDSAAAAHPSDVGIVFPIDFDAEVLNTSVEFSIWMKRVFVAAKGFSEKVDLIHADVDGESSLSVEKGGCFCIDFGIGVKEIQRTWVLRNFGGLSWENETIDHSP